MPNPVKYNESAESRALRKGNFHIGTNDAPKASLGFWNGKTPPPGSYAIYLNKASGGPSIYVTYKQHR